MKIHHSTTSPFVRKCMVSAHELGLANRIERLPAAAHPVQRDRSVIQNNPLGKVPTLLTDDGQALYDSRVICEYLDTLAGGGKLFPRSGAARWEALTLQALGDGMLDALVLVRYEDTARPEALRWPQWRAGQLDKASTSLAYLEAHAAVLRDRVDVGSIAIACALGYLDFRFADFGWPARYPQVAAWWAQFNQRPSMVATQPLP